MAAEIAAKPIPRKGSALKTSVWMPLYIGDYLADTIDLTNREHGSYLLCIMKYWQKGESLTERELKQICGRDTNRVCQFFEFEGHRWHHARIDGELETAWRKRKEAHDKAMKMVAARKAKGMR